MKIYCDASSSDCKAAYCISYWHDETWNVEITNLPAFQYDANKVEYMAIMRAVSIKKILGVDWEISTDSQYIFFQHNMRDILFQNKIYWYRRRSELGSQICDTLAGFARHCKKSFRVGFPLKIKGSEFLLSAKKELFPLLEKLNIEKWEAPCKNASKKKNKRRKKYNKIVVPVGIAVTVNV